MRRIPKQARSKAKVAAIVEAATEQLRLVGYEGLSTVEVAKQAGVSAGTLYQFFDHKDDLLEAIAEEHTVALSQFGDVFFGPDAVYVPSEILVGRMIDWLVAHNQRYPTFHTLFGSAWNDERLMALMNETMGNIIGGLAEVILHRAPTLTPERAHLGATVLVSLTKGMFSMLEAAKVDAHPAIIAEVKHISLLYFNDLLSVEA